MKQPWLKFYPADWRADAAVRSCSLAARGLWIEMLCLMHEAGGSLMVNGRALAAKQLAAIIGIAIKECERLLAELDDAGVFSRDAEGVIYSRRIRRDIAKAAQDRENGKGGGNPKLKPGVNPPDKAQKPDARSQRPEDNPEPPQPYEPAAAADENEWSKLEWTLRQAAGLENAPLASLSNLSIIVGRMKAGMSLDDVIVPAIRSVAARNGKGRSWAYYADAIDEYAASMAGAGKAAKAVPSPQVDDLAHEPTVPVLGGNEVRVSLIHRIWGNGTWNAAWGPEPGRDGCYLPEEMQRELIAKRSVAA